MKGRYADKGSHQDKLSYPVQSKEHCIPKGPEMIRHKAELLGRLVLEHTGFISHRLQV